LVRSASETRRLILQERVIGQSTERLLVSAGIRAGMRVLDVGSGAGDVSLLVGRLVGAAGSVLGVEIDEESVRVARQRALEAGLNNVEVLAADVMDFELPSEFDAVVGRLVLMHLPDPVTLLGRVVRALRGGGVVVFQEAHLASPWLSFPPSPTLERLQCVRAADTAAGARPLNLRMGLALRQAFLSAGLPEPAIRGELVVGGGAHWPGFELLEETMRSVLPLWRQSGIEGADQIEVDGLAARLRSEVGEDGSIMLYPLVGAWTRLPADDV
jgi:SAM-dependent methyltransferase